MSQFGKEYSEAAVELFYFATRRIAKDPSISPELFPKEAAKMAASFREAAELLDGCAGFAEQTLSQLRNSAKL